MSSDRGSTFYQYTGETTEWDDILIEKGIKTRDEILADKGLDPNKYRKEEEQEVPEVKEEEGVVSKLKNATLKDMDELEEDEFDDDRILDEYRRKRIAEMKEYARKARFGELREISREDWIADVTEASNSSWVVVYLYQNSFNNSIVECELMEEAIRSIAPKFPTVKFVKIRSTSAVENWPDRNLPTLFMYRDGKMVDQILGAKSLGGKRITPDDLEWRLAKSGVIETELTEDPSLRRTSLKLNIMGKSRETRQEEPDES